MHLLVYFVSTWEAVDVELRFYWRLDVIYGVSALCSQTVKDVMITLEGNDNEAFSADILDRK